MCKTTESPSEIQRAVAMLQAGEVVAIPTETVYGLAGSIYRLEAIRKIFAVKERPLFDPLIVHIHSVSQISSIAAEYSNIAAVLAERFWPGPLTMVLPARPELNRLITSGLDTVGIRCPAHPIAAEILRRLGEPLAAPSANKFGKTSPTTAAHVRAEFEEADVFVVDGGSSEVGIESTVVELFPGKIRILRPGAITAAEIAGAIEGLGVQVLAAFGSSIASPGHLAAHYQPAVPLVIVDSGDAGRADVRSKVPSLLNREVSRFVTLSLDSDPLIAARTLYDSLRRLAEDADVILVERNDLRVEREIQRQQWEAVWDRLKRAATLDLSAG